MATKNTTTAPASKLPESVASVEAEWPGSSRGRKPSPLQEQIMTDLEGMNHGSVRFYEIADDALQAKFISLFRKCVDATFVDEEGNPVYGVQTSVADGGVYVKIGDRRQRS